MRDRFGRAADHEHQVGFLRTPLRSRYGRVHHVDTDSCQLVRGLPSEPSGSIVMTTSALAATSDALLATTTLSNEPLTRFATAGSRSYTVSS